MEFCSSDRSRHCIYVRKGKRDWVEYFLSEYRGKLNVSMEEFLDERV